MLFYIMDNIVSNNLIESMLPLYYILYVFRFILPINLLIITYFSDKYIVLKIILYIIGFIYNIILTIILSIILSYNITKLPHSIKLDLIFYIFSLIICIQILIKLIKNNKIINKYFIKLINFNLIDIFFN
jgi:hypothetical protein